MTTPKLHIGGALRPVVNSSFATLIMHHEDRIGALEMRHSLMRLEALLPLYYATTEPATVRNIIYKWGKLIRLKFDADNARLVHLLDDSGVAQLGAAVRDMGQAMGSVFKFHFWCTP